MKTCIIFILLCFPLLTFSQRGTIPPLDYSILVTGEKFIDKNLPDSAFFYAKSIYSRKKANPFELRQAYFIAGKALLNKEEPEAAIDFLEKSLYLSEKYGDEILLLKVKLAIAAALGSSYPPQLDSAIAQLSGTKELAEKLRDTTSLANYFIYTANLQNLSKNYEQALLNHTYCEVLLERTNFNLIKAKNLANKGNNALEIFTLKEDKTYLQKSIESYKKAIEIFKIIKDTINEAHTRNSLAESYLYTEDLDGAASEVQQSIKLGKGLSDPKVLLNGYYTLANLYEMNQNPEKAIEALSNLKLYLEKSKDAADLAFMDEQFKEGEAKTSIALIKSKIGIFAKQIENKRLEKERTLWVFVCMLIGITALGLFFYFNQRRKLHRKEVENILQAQELNYMKARQEGEEDSRHRIARQIHDGVGGFLVSAKWNLESTLEELPNEDSKVAARLSENLKLQEHSYKELRRVVYALEKEDTAWWDDLQKFYQQLSAHDTVKIRFYTYNLDRRVRGHLGKEARFIVQEIITNALKHAKATEINVQINQIEDTLGIIIEDNGNGFDHSKIMKGVGFKSIEERCSNLGGSVSFESEKGHGTTVFVDLPIHNLNGLKENPLLYAGTN